MAAGQRLTLDVELRQVAKLGVERVQDRHGRAEAEHRLRGDLRLDLLEQIDDGRHRCSLAANPKRGILSRLRVEVVRHHIFRHDKHLQAVGAENVGAHLGVERRSDAEDHCDERGAGGVSVSVSARRGQAGLMT